MLIPSHTEAKYSPGLMSAHSPGHGCLHCGCTASQMPSELIEPPVYPAQASVTNEKYNTAVLHSSQYQSPYNSLGCVRWYKTVQKAHNKYKYVLTCEPNKE